MNFSMRMLIAALVVLLTEPLAHATIEQAVSAEQFSNRMHFHVRLHNHEALAHTFLLTQLAQRLVAPNLNVSTFDTKSQQITIAAGATADLEYDISADPSRTYALTSEDLWTPVLQVPANVDVAQHFTFTAKLLPGHVAVDSTTGQNQEELDLVLCACTRYSADKNRLQVVLQQRDDRLAQTILAQLKVYMRHFEMAYGRYPYDSFTVVESADPIGYAFPKMTWMGGELLRFPFILKSSLPHELLHSWWGNGVFVDYRGGNWCEGLTSYGADYGLLGPADQRLYRLKALTNFMDYAGHQGEIPLSQFISRGENRTLQAIGYDKAMMVLLMAEERVGHAVFQKALRQFYSQYQFRKATYADLFAILSQLSGQDFTEFTQRWVYGLGSLPAQPLNLKWELKSAFLKIEPTVTKRSEFQNIPLSFDVESSGSAWHRFTHFMPMSGNDAVQLRNPPLRYVFDPDFELFRQLSPEERPTVFSEVFTATQAASSLDVPSWSAAFQSELPSLQLNSISPLGPMAGRRMWIVSLDQAANDPEITTALMARGIALSTIHMQWQGHVFDRTHFSVFAAVKIQDTVAVVVGIAADQSPTRVIDRWQHYASKSFVVLNGSGAEAQEIWSDALLRNVESE